MREYKEIMNPLWLSRYDWLLLMPIVFSVTSLETINWGIYKMIIKTRSYGLNLEFVRGILDLESGTIFPLSVSVDYALKGTDGLVEYCLKVEL